MDDDKQMVAMVARYLDDKPIINRSHMDNTNGNGKVHTSIKAQQPPIVGLNDKQLLYVME